MIGVYTVRDIVAEQHSDLKLFKNEALAQRWFEQVKKESPIGSDLQLFKVCDYDIDRGIIKPVSSDDTFGFEFIQGGDK